MQKLKLIWLVKEAGVGYRCHSKVYWESMVFKSIMMANALSKMTW